jgi:thiamine-phosphate pyrophosphorylase
MLLYYITDRTQFPGSPARQRDQLLAKIAEAARAGVDFIQLREKDLPARDLDIFAREAVKVLLETRNPKLETRLLINSRTDVALAAGADGVHLPADDISPADARAIWASASSRKPKRETRSCLVAVSCHTLAELRLAESHGADFAVFGPVFQKLGTTRSLGLDALRSAIQRAAPAAPKTESVPFGHMPLLAIGGITVENARSCIEAGAAGVAAIRLFQQNPVEEIVEKLRLSR